MGSARRKAEKSYLKLPNAVRSITDPVVKNREKIGGHVSARGEKGGKIVKKTVSRIIYNPKARRRRS